MTPREVIEHFGTQEKAAAALGLTQGAISQWVVAGRIPPLRQYHIQIATGGALQAEITPAGELHAG